MGNNSVIVKFNALKHHLGFLRKEINRWKQLEWQEVLQGIQGLGSNQFDLYTGTLESVMILSEAGEYLKNNGIDSRERLRAWLGRKGYRTFSLSDGSRWVVRESEETSSYAHIHPARLQPWVYRVKASHVKTLIAMVFDRRDLEGVESILAPEEMSTPYINMIRKERLHLSPVRSLEESRRIAQTFRLIMNDSAEP